MRQIQLYLIVGFLFLSCGSLSAQNTEYIFNLTGGGSANIHSTLNTAVGTPRPSFSLGGSAGNANFSWRNGAIFDGSYFLQSALKTGDVGIFDHSFTTSVWFKLDDNGGDQGLFGNATEGGNNIAMHLISRGANLLMGFYSNDTQSSGHPLDTGQWYHAIFAYDKDLNGGTQTIYLNGVQIATGTGHSPFGIQTNTNAETGEVTILERNDAIRLARGMGANLKGSMKDVIYLNYAIGSEAEALELMNREYGLSYTFLNGYLNPTEWYQGGGADVFRGMERGGNAILGSYRGTANVYGVTNNDDLTGMVWGLQFRVADTLTEANKNLVLDITAGNANLATSSTSQNGLGGVNNGGYGFALWDIDAGDFVYRNGNIVVANHGNSNDDIVSTAISLEGLEGKNLMIVGIDRQTGGWAWPALYRISAEPGAVSPLGTHNLVLTQYDFDKNINDGGLSGWYEVDANEKKLGSISNFTLGNGDRDDLIRYYVDTNGSYDTDRGFLSSATVGGDPSSVGEIRSPGFLLQGDILEFHLGGDGGLADFRFELVDARTGEVLMDSADRKFQATGVGGSSLYYDFWNLKDVQNTPAYLRLVDENEHGSIYLDQVRQVMFSPTASQEAMFNSRFVGSTAAAANDDPENLFVVKVFETNDTISSITEAKELINSGATPTSTQGAYVLTFEDNTWSETANSVVVQATKNLEVAYDGFYTLALRTGAGTGTGNFEMLIDDAVLAGWNLDSGTGFFLQSFYFESGWYDFELTYFDNLLKGNLEFYVGAGELFAWNSDLFSPVGMNDYDFGGHVPEPATWTLLLLGLAGGMLWRRKMVG